MTGLKCERLVKRIAQGDEAAVAELYNAVGRQMFALAYSILDDYQLSEDAIQESLLSIIQNATKLNSYKAAYSWVITIVRNSALDILRKRKKECPEEESYFYDLADPRFNDNSNTSIDVHNALSKLDEEIRQLVLLKAAMGFSHKEIAKIFGISVSASQKRYQRALAEIKDYLT